MRYLLFLFVVCMSDITWTHTPIQPEKSVSFDDKGLVCGKHDMVVTAHPEATNAAQQILAMGGSAADAAIAAQFVLGLVEPQSSGIGGGGFALYFDADPQALHALDARETAPSSITPELFLDSSGQPMEFDKAAKSGRSVGTPGLLSMLVHLHQKFGRLPWKSLCIPAIKLAEQGFRVSNRTAQMLPTNSADFSKDPEALTYFYPHGRALQAGQIITNKAYASTLTHIANTQATDFYHGPFAQAISNKVKQFDGGLDAHDLNQYKMVERPSLCKNYRGYKICSIGEPSSGGITLLQALSIIAHNRPHMASEHSTDDWHQIIEASRLSFADRAQYIADSDIVPTPSEALLEDNYIQSRAALIDPHHAMTEVQPGKPHWTHASQAPDTRHKNTGTTHISIMDTYGDVISMTTCIENAFGSRLMTHGFLLNNQLTDFSFTPIDATGQPIANRPQGSKRPRSSMTPVIVFDKTGEPFIAIGSAGGSRIIGYVLQALIAILDWELPLDKALSMPHILHRGSGLETEPGTDRTLRQSLSNMGHQIRTLDMNSGLSALISHQGNLCGAADPRRDGIASAHSAATIASGH